MAREKTEEGEKEVSVDIMSSDRKETSDEVSVVDVLKRTYTPLKEAKEEIWRRWNNEALKKKVREFLGGDIPEPLRDAPKIVLARHAISPNGDLLEFLKVARYTSLGPAFFEPGNDKFVSSNPDKYFLGKMKFYYDIGKSGLGKFYSLKVVDFDKYDGKSASSIQTVWGESFLNFHHRILDSSVPGKLSSKIYNISPWIGRNGGSAVEFYPKYLALFLCYGVLAEIFFSSKEGKFINDVLIPSLEVVESTFGMKPLIVRIFSEKVFPEDQNDEDLHWMCYPASVAKLLPLQHEHISSHRSFYPPTK